MPCSNIASREMSSSWPIAALVVGVMIGSGYNDGHMGHQQASFQSFTEGFQPREIQQVFTSSPVSTSSGSGSSGGGGFSGGSSGGGFGGGGGGSW